MLACGRRTSKLATALTRAGSISGSSPWTLTTISSSESPSRALASANRSLPDGWSVRVRTDSTPCAAQASVISVLSAATTTRGCQLPGLPDSTRRATRTTMGSPPISTRGLLGRRVEASLAGISTVKLTGRVPRRSGFAPRFQAGQECRRVPDRRVARYATAILDAPGRSSAGPWRLGKPAVQAIVCPWVDDIFAGHQVASHRSISARQSASRASNSGTASASGW